MPNQWGETITPCLTVGEWRYQITARSLPTGFANYPIMVSLGSGNKNRK